MKTSESDGEHERQHGRQVQPVDLVGALHATRAGEVGIAVGADGHEEGMRE
ncbi:MAG TPA: hypothetical protein VF838_06980 [Trebonia sp.]